MKKIMLGLFVTALAMLVADTASAVMIDAIKAVGVYQAWPDTNTGNFGSLDTGNVAGGDARGYLQFDLSSFPMIDSAYLWMTSYSAPAPDDVSVYGTSNDWTLPTWNDQPGLGLFGSTTTVGSGSSSWDVTSLAQSSAGGIFSLVLASADNPTSSITYYGTCSRLDVTPTSKVPEPATTLLLGISGATFAVFRRLKSGKNTGKML